MHANDLSNFFDFHAPEPLMLTSASAALRRNAAGAVRRAGPLFLELGPVVLPAPESHARVSVREPHPPAGTEGRP